MATLATSGLALPKHLASGVWQKVQTGSAIAALSGQTPMLFGETQYMTLTAAPKGEVVAEGANKAQSQPTYSSVTVVPRKVQVTTRVNEEVQWADEDYQLGVLSGVADLAATALSRALDLIAIHGINPLTGVALSGSPAKLMDTSNSVEIGASSKATDDLEAAVGLVLSDGFTPSGVALDPSFAFSLATTKDADGRRLYPELGLGIGLSSVFGLPAAVSTTVSAPEATVVGGAYASANPNVKAITGDFQNAIRWGVQRDIPIEVIRFGDPDGDGDLKRKNQIALRAEVVYGIAIFSTDAFAKVINAA